MKTSHAFHMMPAALRQGTHGDQGLVLETDGRSCRAWTTPQMVTRLQSVCEHTRLQSVCEHTRLQSVCEHTGPTLSRRIVLFSSQDQTLSGQMWLTPCVPVLRVAADALRTTGSAVTEGAAPVGLEQPHDDRSSGLQRP